MNNRVREYRIKAGLTQEQLAAHLGVSRQTIISIEKRRFDPSLSLAFDLSSVLAVPLEKLFFR